MDWKTSSSSAFYLSAEKSLVKTEEELLAFDFEDLVNGLGGALGLFLGWSLLHIFGEIFKLLQQIRGWVLGGWVFFVSNIWKIFLKEIILREEPKVLISSKSCILCMHLM